MIIINILPDPRTFCINNELLSSFLESSVILSCEKSKFLSWDVGALPLFLRIGLLLLLLNELNDPNALNEFSKPVDFLCSLGLFSDDLVGDSQILSVKFCWVCIWLFNSSSGDWQTTSV